MIKAYAAQGPGEALQSFEYDPGSLGADEVEIQTEYCGICHSDLSMLDNDWGMTEYPFVPGHEIIGTLVSAGDNVSQSLVGQRVGVGWNAHSCMTCEWCVGGDHNLCASAQGVIVGRHGGFADRVRVDAAWVFPIPAGLPADVVGPLLCGGITVFNPLVQFDVKPTDRVGVIGIGGLGHMALKFMSAYGCEVTAFSSSADKEAEARHLGADHFVNSRDADALNKRAGSLDFIMSTVNVPLDWMSYMQVLRPKGRLHMVGMVLEPLELSIGPMMFGQKSLSASPTGSPATIRDMLEFAARHRIEPLVESFPLADVNAALEKLRHGEPRYRLVLKM
jgi:uncharacterized zinc-type alcohol dehydrogenase-like protein